VNRGHHFLTSRYIDPRIYHGVSSQYILDCQRVAASLDVDRLWREVNALPAEWRTPSALDGFTQCLSRLSTTCLLQGVLDTMVDAQQRTYESERGEYEAGRRLPMRVLCEGNLRLLIHPEFRALLQDEDRAYFQALLIDLPERAKLQPDALFKQLCSLGVGPLVTQTVGEDLTGNPALLELSSTFVQL
jgi:hypothetical protein